MKRLLMFLLLAITLRLGAEEIVLRGADIISLVTENNAAVRISAAGEELARGVYDQILASGRPGVSFSTDSFSSPLYGYSKGAVAAYGFSEETESHTVSAGFSVRQLTPTGGNATLSVDNSLAWSRAVTEEEWEITQDPGLALSVFQPIFVNGRFIDPSVMKNTRRNGEIGVDLSRVRNQETMNNILIGVLSTVLRVSVLRDSVLLLEKSLDLADLRLQMARQDRERGRISESDLLGIELDVGRQREALFDVRYQLALAELDLSGLLGLDEVSGYSFDLDYGATESLLGDRGGGLASDLSGNPAVLQAALDAEQARLSEQLNGVEEAPVLSLSFQAGPRYPSARADAGDLTSSFTDLFSEDAGVDVSVNLALQFDAWDGGAARARKQADRAAVVMAEEGEAEARRAAAAERTTLLARLDLLNDRIALLESNIAYDRRLLQREIDRQALGASTNVDVETVRLELESRERDIENLLGERYLLGLQLVSLAGMSVEEFILQ